MTLQVQAFMKIHRKQCLCPGLNRSLAGVPNANLMPRQDEMENPYHCVFTHKLLKSEKEIHLMEIL